MSSLCVPPGEHQPPLSCDSDTSVITGLEVGLSEIEPSAERECDEGKSWAGRSREEKRMMRAEQSDQGGGAPAWSPGLWPPGGGALMEDGKTSNKTRIGTKPPCSVCSTWETDSSPCLQTCCFLVLLPSRVLWVNAAPVLWGGSSYSPRNLFHTLASQDTHTTHTHTHTHTQSLRCPWPSQRWEVTIGFSSLCLLLDTVWGRSGHGSLTPDCSFNYVKKCIRADYLISCHEITANRFHEFYWRDGDTAQTDPLSKSQLAWNQHFFFQRQTSWGNVVLSPWNLEAQVFQFTRPRGTKVLKHVSHTHTHTLCCTF